MTQAVTKLALFLGLLLPSTTAAAFAQDQRLTEEMRFARGLATQFQLMDLAEEVLARIDTSGLAAPEQEQLLLARAEIFGEAARFESDPARRRQLFRQSLEGYQEFLARHPLSPSLPEARRSYVNVGATYGLAVQLDLDELAGEPAATLRDDTVRRLSEVATFAARAIADYGPAAELGQLEQRELAQLHLAEAQLRLQIGRLSGDTYHLDLAESVLERLIFLVGEQTGFGLQAYLMLGEIYMVRGEPEVALEDFVSYVLDLTIPRDRAAWERLSGDLTREERQARWQFVELGTPLALEAAEAAGRQRQGTEWALHFINTFTREGFNLSQRGYLTLLDTARTLLNAGGFLGGSPAAGTLVWFETPEEASSAGHQARNVRSSIDQALALANRVNEDNPRSALQVRAQRLISEAISMPGVQVSIQVLHQAAMGEFNSGNNQQAVRAFRRVIAAAVDDAERLEFGGRSFWHIGQSLQREGRHLEAAMAYREGATRFSADPQSSANNARSFYRAMQQVRRSAPGDNTIEQLWLESERLAAELDTQDSADILFQQGERSFNEGNHAGALALYRQVPPEALTYELARVKAAIARYHMGELEEAERELREYVEVFVADPRNRLGPQDGARRERRNLALTEAYFHLALIAFDQRRWADAIAGFSSFAEEFASQPAYAAAALRRCVFASIELGQLTEARQFLSRMLERFEAQPDTGVASTRLYNHLRDQRQQAIEAGETERASELLGEMAELLRISNQLSPRPQFTALRDEGNFWLELGKWVEAERAFARARRDFGNEAALAQQMERVVLPGLGRALLMQRRAQEAFEVLSPLVPNSDEQNPTLRPSIATAEHYALSIVGWFEGSGNEPTVVPGIGGADRLRDAAGWLGRIGSSREQWSCEWYEAEALRIWANIQLGRDDPERMRSAATRLNWLVAQGGADFADVRRKCGDEVLQRRFRWLQGRAR